MDRIRVLALDQHFNRAALKSAEELASADALWREPVAWYRPSGSPADALLGEWVESTGSSAYVTVYLYTRFGSEAVESTCQCGVASCAHAAGLLIRLRRLVDWPRALSPLERWQHTLRHRSELPLPKPAPPPVEQQFLCLLQPTGTQDPCTLLAWFVSGEPGAALSDSTRWVTLEQLPPATLLPAHILLWQARLARGPRNARATAPGHELRGSAGAALLREWLEAGICYHAETLERVSPGPPRQPKWTWWIDTEAQRRLRLLGAEEEAIRVAQLDGLYYLDEKLSVFGVLSVTPVVWSMVRQMPPIPPEETRLHLQWPPHPQLRDIPPPPPAPNLAALHASLRPILVIGASRQAIREEYVFYVTAWADYGGCRLPLAQELWRACLTRRVAGEFATVHRQVEAEAAAHQVLKRAELVGLRKVVPDAWRVLSPAPPLEALAHRQHYRGGTEAFVTLESLLRALSGAPFEIEYDPQLPFAVLPEDTPLEATLRESTAAGWTQFQLTAVDEGGDIDVLPIVLQGLRRREFSLTPQPHESPNAHWLAPVGPDRFLPLGLARLREWLAPLVTYLGRTSPTRDSTIDLPDAQAMGLGDCLRRQEIDISGPKAAQIAATLAALRAAKQAECAVPRTFSGTLRPYQTEGLEWLQTLRAAALGGVLADDMGLGKTVQVIAHLALEAESGRLTRPALVIASTTLIFNWQDELARFAPSLTVINFTGGARAGLREHLASANVILVSYALLATELPLLQALEYSVLVLDEAQWVKNPFTRTARAVRALRAPHKLALTGTPLENHLGELWAHLDVVLPGFLGDYRSFNRSFRTPIERHQDDRRMAALRELITPFVLRRTKKQVAPELPPKTEAVLHVTLADDQRALYESLRLALSEDVRVALDQYSEGQSQIVVLSALMRLRQVCCDPRLIAKPGTPAPRSAKLDALMGLVRSLRDEERQVLIFSQFTSMLELISQELRHAHLEHAILTGDTTDRRTPVRRFQESEVAILLASLKAGGVGLNLTAADAVIHYDPWWNPAVEQQASDRAHRLGREQPVFIYQLLCEDTIEEKIASMKGRKSDLAQALLGESRFGAHALTDQDIRELFELAAP
ncbi:MAG TPA: DEAD/DEAH box helicase [Steroidobacteraceae bacterium]|nr:DEAD/DEAH box helicase [Steroidobacteraceae bacterium]